MDDVHDGLFIQELFVNICLQHAYSLSNHKTRKAAIRQPAVPEATVGGWQALRQAAPLHQGAQDHREHGLNAIASKAEVDLNKKGVIQGPAAGWFIS